MPAEPERGVAGWIGIAVVAGLVAVRDPFAEAATVDLGSVRLADHLVPVMGVAGQQAPVAHDESHARRVEGILDEFQEAAQVALPAIGVAGEEDVESAGAGGGQHGGHGGMAPHRPTRGRDLPGQAGVDQGEALGEALHLLALAVRAIPVELLAGRFA